MARTIGCAYMAFGVTAAVVFSRRGGEEEASPAAASTATATVSFPPPPPPSFTPLHALYVCPPPSFIASSAKTTCHPPPQSPLDSKTRRQKTCRPILYQDRLPPQSPLDRFKRRVDKRRVAAIGLWQQGGDVPLKIKSCASASAASAPHTTTFFFHFLTLDMEPTTPHRPRGAANLFSPSVPLQESPGSMSSLSASEFSPQSSPQLSPRLEGESDLISHPHLFGGLLPGDVGYAFPDPNATSISHPGIATLTDDETDFNDYNKMSYDDKVDDEKAEEQVGGGAYGLRGNISRPLARTAPNTDADADADAPAPAPMASTARRVRRVPAKKTPLPAASTPQVRLLPPPSSHHAPPPAVVAPQQTPLQQRAPTKQRAPPQQQQQQRAPPQQQQQEQRAPPQQQQQRAPSKQRAVRSETPAPRGAATPHPPTTLVAPAPMQASSLHAPTRSGTPQEYRPIPPELFQGTLPEFMNQGGFSSFSLPPPPRDWADARRISPRPPPVAELDFEAKQELEDDPLANDEEQCDEGDPQADVEERGDQDRVEGAVGDTDEDTTPIVGDTVEEEVVPIGRPTQEQREEIDAAKSDVCERLMQCSCNTGIPYGVLLKWIYTDFNTGLRPGKHGWNDYQRFANFNDKNCLRERRRLDPDYPATTPIPALKADELSRAYKAFVLFAGGEAEAGEMLDLFFQMGGPSDDTIQGRRRRFTAAMKTLEKQTQRLRTDDFFALTILVGAHTNEDEKLGEVIAIPELQQALYEALDTSEAELVGIQKTAAAYVASFPPHFLNSQSSSTVIIREQAKLRRDNKSATAASSSTAAPSAAAAAVPASAVPAGVSASVAAPFAAGTAATAPLTAGTAAAEAAARLPAVTPTMHRDETTKSTAIFACEIRQDTPDLQDMRRIFRMASVEDLGVDAFEGNNGFPWTVLAQQLFQKGFCIRNFPANVRLPSEAPAAKASGSWNRGERRWLRFAIAARSTPGQGLRFERVMHTQGNRSFVVLSHDYDLPPPTGAPDSDVVRAFWNSSAVPMHCTAGDNTTWETAYNIDDPTTLARPAPSKADVKAGKRKVEPPVQHQEKGTASSQKRRADEESGEDQLQPESEEKEETSPPVKKKRRYTPESQVGGGGVLASPRRVEVAQVKRLRNDFPKTPPRVGGAQSRVRFRPATADAPSSSDDNDDKPLQPLPPTTTRPKPLYDSDDEPAPARRNPKPAVRKRVPSDESEGDVYSDDGDAAEEVAEDPPIRITRASSKGLKPAASKPTASKSATAKAACPNANATVKVFDAVEITTPPKKKSKGTAAAPAPAAARSKLSSAAAAGTPRRRPAAPAAPTAFAPAAFNPAAFNPAALAGLTPAQLAQMQAAVLAAFFGGAPPPPGA
ncbi:hypothetical protein B0H19DRAFT_1267495 [Mycena capillaripes]|nr:hypothetical protein B0H19DRAFT_1267495 [Mycena capillaripes]